MATRTTKVSKVVRKNAWKCVGGPFADTTLYLCTGSTLPFSYKGESGRYIANGYLCLVWEAANAKEETNTNLRRA